MIFKNSAVKWKSLVIVEELQSAIQGTPHGFITVFQHCPQKTLWMLEEQFSPQAFLVFFLSAKYTSEATYRTVNNLCKILDQRSPKSSAQSADINDFLSFT